MEKTSEKFQRHIKWQSIRNRLNAFLIIFVKNFRIKIILGDGTTNVPNKTSQASKLRHFLSLVILLSPSISVLLMISNIPNSFRSDLRNELELPSALSQQGVAWWVVLA